jgi:hypothetical protein
VRVLHQSARGLLRIGEKAGRRCIYNPSGIIAILLLPLRLRPQLYKPSAGLTHCAKSRFHFNELDRTATPTIVENADH